MLSFGKEVCDKALLLTEVFFPVHNMSDDRWPWRSADVTRKHVGEKVGLSTAFAPKIKMDFLILAGTNLYWQETVTVLQEKE